MFRKRNSKNRIFSLICLMALFFNLLPQPDFFFGKIASRLKARNIVDKVYLAKKNPNVVDNFKLGAQSARAASDPAESEYMIDIGPINGTATANYAYASFFNPAGSGRTAVIKRIAVKANAVAAANYVNLSVRRTTAASAGTQIVAANIPKKNNSSVDSAMEVRHTGAAVTLAGTADSRILGQPMPGAVGQFHSFRDISFGEGDEKLVIRPGEGIVLYQEAAGDLDQRIRLYAEWEEVASAPSAQSEFLFAFPRVEVAAAANYAYNSFFNPSASGKAAIVKRIWFGTETCDTTAAYTNNISLRRITSASGGTAITASNVPKKNTGSANSVMDFRRSGPTVGLVGTAEARLGIVTPCAAAGQPHGWQQINFQQNDEKLILQQGEGVALISEATGDVDQLVRMIVEWQEVATASAPSSQGEYMFAFHRISNVAPAINTTFYTFFNPIGSGKTAVVKKLGIRNNADAAATYAAFNWRRLTAASGGTQIAATDVVKKHSSTANSSMELRSCGTTCASPVSATYAGTADSRLLTVNGAGAVGQIIGQKEVIFGDNEKLILQPGEGVGFYIDVLAGDVDHYVKAYVEWDEEASAPSAQGEYFFDVGPINGSTAANYAYASFFNPAASGKAAVIKKINLRVDTVSTAVYIPMAVRRTSAASGGIQIAAANVPKKHSGAANSAMEIRRTGATVTLSGSADSRLIGIQTSNAAGTAVAPSISGHKELVFENDERIILQPGEGLALYQEAAGDADFRVKIMIEWQEVSSASAPGSQGEYLLSMGPVNGSTSAGYVYSSLFNPVGSGKNYVVKRMEIRVNRVGTLVAPGYIPAIIRRTTAASSGTQIAVANVPKKHSGTSSTTAEIRHTNPTVALAGATESRLLGVTVPGTIRQYGEYENAIIYGDEFILQPGEGIALYQEATSGDTLLKFRMAVEWSEADAGGGGGTLSVDIVDGAGSSVTSPTVIFANKNFNWVAQQAAGVLGFTTPSVQKIRLNNTTANANWTLSIAATSGVSALWQGATYSYDFNGTLTTGRLYVDPTVTVTPQGGCSTTGINSSQAAYYFEQGVRDSITLVSASGAQTNCYWDITGVDLTQDIPAGQRPDGYSIGMTLTAV